MQIEPPERPLAGPNGQLSDVATRILLLTRPLDDVDRMYVLRRARACAEIHEDEATLVCVRALRAARGDATKAPSTNRYQSWLNEQERPHPHPSIFRVRAVLGGPAESWALACQKAFDQPEADPTVSRVVARSAIRIGPDLLKRRVQEYCQGRNLQDGPPKLDEFLRWSRAQAKAVGTFDDPYPLSGWEMGPDFDGWFHLLQEAGVTPLPRTSGRLVAEDVSFDGLDVRARELIRAAHLMASCGSALSRKRLLAYVEEMTRDEQAGRDDAPCSKSFFKLCGEWRPFLRTTRLVAARTGMEYQLGVRIATATETRVSAAEEYSDEEIFAFLGKFVEEYGPGAGRSEFLKFRAKVLRDASSDGRDVFLPGLDSIRDRFGGLAMGMAAAGLIPPEDAVERSRPDYTMDDRLDAMEDAIRACGRGLSFSTYRRYGNIRRRRRQAEHFPSVNSVSMIDEEHRMFLAAREITIEKRGLQDVPYFISDLRSHDG